MDPRHQEVRYDDGDNHGVILVDEIDALEVLVRKGDRRKTLLQGCINKINVDVPDGMWVPFSGLIVLSTIAKALSNGVDYTSDVLGGFLF